MRQEFSRQGAPARSGALSSDRSRYGWPSATATPMAVSPVRRNDGRLSVSKDRAIDESLYEFIETQLVFPL